MDAEFNQVVTALNRKVLCSASAPANPINGQTWVDTTNKLMKCYLNSEWVIVNNVFVQVAEPGTPAEGYIWYDTADNVLKVYNGSTWDTLATTTDVSDAVDINAKAEKETLAADDLFLIEDSADENAKKKVKYSNVYPFAYTHYDSGWFSITRNGTLYTKTHNLGTTTVLAIVYGATAADGTNMGVINVYTYNDGGGIGCLQGITTSQISVAFQSYDFIIVNTTRTAPTYARIIMLALD